MNDRTADIAVTQIDWRQPSRRLVRDRSAYKPQLDALKWAALRRAGKAEPGHKAP
ncbi:MAG: hypothetical protein IPG91_20410 [Ideonella sp.]|nr:hypothetical protein [Ideonella sp.]